MTDDEETNEPRGQRRLGVAPVPGDVVDTTNVPEEASQRAQTPIDALGDISDEDILVERGARPSRSGA